MNTLLPKTTGHEALTESWVRLRHGNEKSTRPPAGSIDINPPVGGSDSPPANTNTRRFPWMVAGTGRICTDLMPIVAPGIVVKTGAEGLFCLALRERGWGVAIKVADGSIRALPAITAAVLRQLGVVTEEQLARFLDRQPSHIRNNAGAVVGEVRATFSLN